jgi:hypothetical protein
MSSQRIIGTFAALCFAWILPHTAAADCGGTIASLKPASLQQSVPRVAQFDDRIQLVSSGLDQPSIVGLWSVTLTSGGSVIDFGYDAWHADGTETLTDASPISHNVCLGVWKQTGRRTVQLKHPALRFDPSGNVIGTLILRETNVLNRAGDRFTGTFTIEFFDLNGVSVFIGTGEIVGERVTVD